MKTVDGKATVISGASRCGKTAYTLQDLEGVLPSLGGRACAWDPEDQWAQLPGWRRVTSRAELLRWAHHPGPMKIAYVAGGDLKKEFDFWAGCMMYASRYISPLGIVAEELADVTSASKAPGNWGVLLRRVLKRGSWIWSVSQRWAEADKTAMGNCAEFVIFRQNTADDAKYMSRKTRVPQAEIDTLKPFEFIKYNTHSFEMSRDMLNFAKKLPGKRAAIRSKSP